MTEINYLKVAKLRPEKLLKTGKQIKRNVVSLITKNEREISFIKLLTVLVSLLAISLSLPTLSPGDGLEIRQEVYHYQVPFAEVIPSETFVISNASEQAPVKTIISEKSTQTAPAPAPFFSNPVTVHFQFDSAEITPAERTNLLSLLHEFKVPQGVPLTVTGFTCKMGPPEFNIWLSNERAKAVSALLEDEGYTVAKIEGKGATDLTTEQNGPNRRVEITPFETISAHIGQPQISTKEETP